MGEASVAGRASTRVPGRGPSQCLLGRSRPDSFQALYDRSKPNAETLIERPPLRTCAVHLLCANSGHDRAAVPCSAGPAALNIGSTAERFGIRPLAPGPHDGLCLHYRALRNHDIAVRHFLSEARTTKIQEVTDASRATEQIIAYQNRNKANKASCSASTSCSRCAVCDDRWGRRRNRRRIPSGRPGRKTCSRERQRTSAP